MGMLPYIYCLLRILSICTGIWSKTFQPPSLVWFEERGEDVDHTRVQKVELNPITFSIPSTDEDKLKTMAMTEAGYSPYTSIDVDYGNMTLVAVARSKKKIMAVSFDQDGFQIHWQLFEGTSSKVNGIAVDWTTDVVYWTDAAYNAIFAVSMAMPNIAETIIEDLDEPFGIATHPMKGYLFWTDVGEKPKIMRSSLGGRKHRVVIEFVDQSVPTALSIDFANNRLYWLFKNTAQGYQGFGSSDLYGNNHKITILTEGGFYFDLDVFHGLVYLTNQDYREIHVIPKDSQRPEIRLKIPGTPYGLVVLDLERQVERSNICLHSHCPGVCTRSNSSEDCFCSPQLKVLEPAEVVRRNCGNDAFNGILIPKADGIYTMLQNFAEFSHHTNIKPQRLMASQSPIRALTSDTRLMMVFFYEWDTKIIKSSRIKHGAESEVVSYAVGDVGGITVDGPSKNLYWTDLENGHIMVAKKDGSFVYKLLRNLGKPKAIAIHPPKMYLFWSNLEDYTLNRCYLDGTDCQKIVQGHGFWITDVTVDLNTDKLYWVAQSARSAVYTSDLDGNGLVELYARQNSLFTGISVMYGNVYSKMAQGKRAKDYIIISDSSYESGGLHAVEKSSEKLVGKATYGRFEYGNWFGVHFHHRSNEPKRRSGICALRGNPCEQICVPSNAKQRYTCFCSIGYSLENQTKCVFGNATESRYQPYVLLADQRYQKLLYLSVLSELLVIPVQQIKQPYSVTFDTKRQQVYWSDLDTGTISRANLDGSNQEIIIANPDAYFISLALDPGNRLLYYMVLKMCDFESGEREMCGSIVAYNVEKSKSVVIIGGDLGTPTSLTLNLEYGFGFFVDQGCVYRIDLNGSNMKAITDFTMDTTLVATQSEYVYFTNVISYADLYKSKTTQIWRSDLDGENRTLVLELEHGDMTSLKVYRDREGDLLYWTNTSTRAIHRYSLSRPRGTETKGPSGELFLPTDIFVNFAMDAEEPSCSKLSGYCDGICLPSPYGPGCVPTNKTNTKHIEASNKTKEFCRIPEIQHGEVVGQQESLIVPHGFVPDVRCFPLHKISMRRPMRCNKGEWTDIPKCTLEYDICGNEIRGYKAYTQSGQFFVYPTATKVDVICIGGGGGGYDATNDANKAGDGGDSRFSTYLIAYGGKGGSLLHGGAGGAGHYPGGDGSANINCTTGGTAGEYEKSSTLGVPGISHNLFCGAGGYSDDCGVDGLTLGVRKYAGPGGRDGNGSVAGQYGGGAGSRAGGTGGGGGYSRLSFNLSPREVIEVDVGMAGNPSFGEPGQGIVMVTWGDIKIDDLVRNFDVVKKCIFSEEDNASERTGFGNKG